MDGIHLNARTMFMTTILLIEDDFAIGSTLSSGLSKEHFLVTWERDGKSGYESLFANQPQLLILDWMLPNMDGLMLLKLARAKGITCPTLLLTARDQILDRVSGFEAGADDYLCKPFAFAELLARVKALLRRSPPAAVLEFEDIRLDTVKRKAYRGTALLDLTSREVEMLEFFLRHPGEIVTREMLAVDVWKITQRATPINNVIDVQIGRLRRKLDADGQPKLLHTIRGVGFRLSSEERW